MSQLPELHAAPATPPAWPERLIELARLRRSEMGPDRADNAHAALWRLINAVLRQSIRSQSRRLGPVRPEDVEDLASAKTLDLLRQLDGAHWDPGASSPGETAGFLQTVARNALVDHLRKSGRRAPLPLDEIEESSGLGLLERASPMDGPDHGPARRCFIEALAACAGALPEKHRTIWILRVLYELPTKRIATHPEVALKPGHVDVILQRCRSAIRECMTAKGHAVEEIPPGTFVALWEAFRMGGVSPREEAPRG